MHLPRELIFSVKSNHAYDISYESDSWARQYTTLGYLIAIMSLLAMPILPRAKFLQSLLISVIAICFAAAVSLLSIQCAVAARSAPSGGTRTGDSGSKQALQYSSAANVTACVWLFFHLYLANTLRAARPQLVIVSIQYIIFVIVASTYAPSFPNMEAGMNFVQRLLKTFLSGLALATGVSLFIIPVSSRMISHRQMAGVLNLLKKCLGIHTAYLHGITTSNTGNVGLLDENGNPKPLEDNPEAVASMKEAEDAAKELKRTLQQATRVFGQLKVEIGFAKKEIGWGKLRPSDFPKILTLLQQILLPVAGLSTFVDILQSVKHHKAEGENLIPDMETVEAIRRLEADEWQEVIVMSRAPFHRVREILGDGMTHITYVLELVPRPKSSKKDVEKNADSLPVPGDANFAERLKAEIRLFEEHRETTLRKWCERKGIDVPNKFWEDPSAQYKFEDSASLTDTIRQKQNHQQLYLILYLQYLLLSVCQSILKMILFADSKVQDGTMSKNRLIFPGWRQLRKLLQHAFAQEDSEPAFPDSDATGLYIWLGDSLTKSKDPEHLPPTNWYQRMTNHLRKVPKMMASDASAFGFRAAVASISIAIIGYIHQTHIFYLEQRGIWAVIMVAISMGPTAGAGVQGFLFRILGTIAAMVASIAIWYMSDQKPAAIIPLSYLCFMGGFYVVLKKPKYIISAVISIVTVILVVGYELQDIKIGTKLLASNGQKFYRVYLLGPYRLLTVVVGLAVAFIWTYFPYPITTHATLRNDLGRTLYLLANFYACAHATVETRLRLGLQANEHDKACPIRKLDKARIKVFEKLMVMMNTLREHSEFTRYEPTFGGKFPKQTYDELIEHMQSLFNYMALISYSAQAFAAKPDGEESQWLKDFRRLTAQSTVTSLELTSTLCLVAASMSNSQPLPPYVRVPPPVRLVDQLASIDPGILSVQHVNEPCYAAFAVLEIAGILIMQEITAVLSRVKQLVGEVDFSLHMVDHPSDSTTSSVNNLNGKGKAE